VLKLYRVAKFGLKNRVSKLEGKVHCANLSECVQKT
jgi:hypothetical protein